MDVTFDRFEYIEKLKSSGIEKEQAVAHAEALNSALKDSVATKHDLISIKNDIEIAKRDLKIWTGSLIIGSSGFVIAAIKLIVG